MEDLNVLVADCIVVSCCCQCLILQILVFLLLKLPCKLIKKMKNYVKLLWDRWKHRNVVEREIGGHGNEPSEFHGGSITIQPEGFTMERGHGFRCCMEEVEKVLGELSEKGEFAFGSFWGREVSERETTAIHGANINYESNILQYHFIEMVGWHF